MRVAGVLAVIVCILCGGQALAQEVVAHPDVVFVADRPAGDVLGPRDDAFIAVHDENVYFMGTPHFVTSVGAGVLPTGATVGCMPSGTARREAWRVHFQPNADARSAGAFAFRTARAVGVSFSDDCIPLMLSGFGGFDLPAGALSHGLETEDGVWRSASGQFFALTFQAFAREIDDMRVLTVDAPEGTVDIVTACHGTDPTDFMVDLSASTPAPANTEIALLAVGAASCNLAGAACTPAAGGLFVCAPRRTDMARVTCDGSPVRTVVIAAPPLEGEIDGEPASNVCEVTGPSSGMDGGVADGGGGLAMDGGSLGFDGAVPLTDATIAPPGDGATRRDVGGPGSRRDGGDDPPLGTGRGGPSFQGGGGCMCSTAADPASLAWVVLLGLWIVRRSRVR